MNLEQIRDMMNSEDVGDFDLAIDLLRTDYRRSSPMNVFLRIKDLVLRYLDQKRFTYTANYNDLSFERHKIMNIGLWEQLKGGNKVIYNPGKFSLNDLVNLIK